MKPTLRPEVTIKDDRETLNHDAFGKITVVKSNYGGRGVQLCGSDLTHHATVTVTVSRASVDRMLSANWLHDEETVVEFAMSETQWAQFVSSQGNGSGTPITLNYAPERGTKLHTMPYLELETLQQLFHREIEQKTKGYISEVNDVIKRLDALSKGPGQISKTEAKALLHTLSCKVGNLPSNLGYIQTCLHEAVENYTESAKTEVEAYVGNIATRLGLEEIQKMAPQISETKVPDYQNKKPEDMDTIELALSSVQVCSVCGEQQEETPSGLCCKNGHGGAESV